jgi:hypothetical protein
VNKARQLMHEVERHGARLIAAAPDKVKVVGKVLPPPLIARLRENKPELFALLQHCTGPSASWTARDWRDFFEERAAILEFEVGLQRPDAERRAISDCVSRWLTDNVLPDRTT